MNGVLYNCRINKIAANAHTCLLTASLLSDMQRSILIRDKKRGLFQLTVIPLHGGEYP